MFATVAVSAAPVSAETDCDTEGYEAEHDGRCVDYWSAVCQNDHGCRSDYWQQFHEKRIEAIERAIAEAVSKRIEALDRLFGEPDDLLGGSDGHDLSWQDPPNIRCNPHSDVCLWQDADGVYHNRVNPHYVGPSPLEQKLACFGRGGAWGTDRDGNSSCSK
ncbi:hypothetical protein [Candidatus Poriferisodalis sp.]|uniref:hypothetical protein n=1 Tax=Candidatus Poriferisodalis sp. TaxID=3101277 RepID=UPI003B0155F8